MIVQTAPTSQATSGVLPATNVLPRQMHSVCGYASIAGYTQTISCSDVPCVTAGNRYPALVYCSSFGATPTSTAYSSDSCLDHVGDLGAGCCVEGAQPGYYDFGSGKTVMITCFPSGTSVVQARETLTKSDGSQNKDASPSQNPSPTDESGLSTGAKIATIVGTIVAVLGFTAAVCFGVQRSRGRSVGQAIRSIQCCNCCGPGGRHTSTQRYHDDGNNNRHDGHGYRQEANSRNRPGRSSDQHLGRDVVELPIR